MKQQTNRKPVVLIKMNSVDLWLSEMNVSISRCWMCFTREVNPVSQSIGEVFPLFCSRVERESLQQKQIQELGQEVGVL